MSSPTQSLYRPLYIMAKPAGPVCNMACRYCYYLEKAALYPGRERRDMSDQVLEEFIKSYIQSQPGNSVQFTWHGGEATLRPLSFYRRAMELQRHYSEGRRIENCLQTNGTMLNDEWCRFLRQNNWLVGVSIDGDMDFHDEYRHMRGGRPSFLRVMRGIELLKRHGVEWNAMAVVNDYNADYPEEFYGFFKRIGCRYLQFTPIVERDAAGQVADFSVTPGQWGDFLCRVFDRWVQKDVGRVFVQIFDATLANWVGEEPGLCTMARDCGHAGVIEHNGDVYSCDHFVYPQYLLGNVRTKTVLEMMNSPRQLRFGAAKHGALPAQCLDCQWLRLCNGECPKNRFCSDCQGTPMTVNNPAGGPSKPAVPPVDVTLPAVNYLCAGYRRFFEHTAPAFQFMAAELAAGRAPANIMRQ